jgi:DNA-binding IclR family transcriptional regulator
LPERVQPLLERISVETGEAASATVLIGYVARLVAFQAGTEAITIHFPQWVWPQALKLATGRLLVALGDEARWEEFVTRSPDVRPGWGLEQWKKELKRLRDLGYCALRTDRDDGQTLIAFPLRTRGGQAVAAIGAACPSFRATPERTAKMTVSVHRAATELSRELGGEGPAMPAIDWTALPMDVQERGARSGESEAPGVTSAGDPERRPPGGRVEGRGTGSKE